MEEWKEYRLGEVLTIKYGKDHKKLKEGNIPVYGSGGVMRYVNKAISHGPSLLIPRKGSLNNIIYSPSAFWTVDTMFWTQINSDIANPLFLYYSICKKDFAALNVGTAVPSLTVPVIEDIKISLPDLDIQSKICAILKSLDDKIELNRKINSNLEEQAKALFKSWFIDFEPFKGGKFIDSELGMIPEGWNVKSASDIFNITIGKTPPRKESKWFTKGIGNVWVSISDMKLNGAFIGHSSEKLSDDAIAKFNIVMVPKDTILLSFKLTIGRVAISSCDLTTNEAIARFSIDNPRLREFTYLFLKNYNYQSLGSTSSIATAVNSKIIKSMPFLLPDADTTESFHKLSKPLFDQIEVTQKQTDCLAFIRDTLLPKLMSGEIDVEHSKLLFI